MNSGQVPDRSSEETVWVTGAAGLIGSHLVKAAPGCAPGRRVIALTRERLDLTHFAGVTRAFREDSPTLVIHCAGLTRTGICQADRPRAELENVTVTRHLGELAHAVRFVFLSTDLVFDGRQGNYQESDNDGVHPLSFYAETKVAAEQWVLRNPRHTVVRTSLNAGASPRGDRSFSELMRRAWERGETLDLFTDEFRSPIAAPVTARALWELALKGAPGLFHLAGSERLSRWEIGEALAAHWPELEARRRPASIKDYPGPPRPGDTSLNCSRVQALLSFPLPGLRSWLAVNSLP